LQIEWQLLRNGLQSSRKCPVLGYCHAWKSIRPGTRPELPGVAVSM
jgi:hypothetical protein